MAKATTTRRIAAVIAFLAAVGLGGSLAALVIRNAIAVVVAVAALAGAAYAGWLVLTHRDRRTRMLGAGGAVAAIVLGIVVLIAAGALDEIVYAVISFAVFAVAAPIALRERGAQEQIEPTGPDRSARGERKILLINPRSGDGVAARTGLVEEARRRGIETVVLHPGDDLLELAREAAARADVIGMAGGDGSQALVAGVASEHDLTFVCIPAGTRNHFALDLGVDRNDVVGALDAFRWGTERTVDLARVNGRTFVNNVSLGVYAQIVRSEAYRAAKLATAREMLPDLLGDDAPPLPISLSSPDGVLHQHVRLVLVSNNPYVLDGLVGVGARPKLDTGMLGVVALELTGASDAAALTALDTIGQVKRFGGWHEWSTDTLLVESSEPVPTGIDGESVLLEAPLSFEIAPGALRVRQLPGTKDDHEAHVESRRVSSEVLGNLWGVASGSR